MAPREKGEKRMKIFSKKVRALVEKLGGTITKEDDSYLRCEILTLAGILNVSVHIRASILFSIFCYFDDVEKAKETLKNNSSIYRLNQYSGKWNIHNEDENSCLNIFYKDMLELILKK